MEIIIGLILGIAIGFVMAMFWMRGKADNTDQVKTARQLADTEKQLAIVRAQLDAERNAAATHERLVREEVRNMTQQMLNDSKQQLRTENSERMNDLLMPLKERLESFQKAVSDNSKENTANKAELKTVFMDAMKQLNEVQERTVRQLQEQTEKIAGDAQQLTEALKGDSKMQGDWGEMILERTLEDCGLAKNQQYFLQENYKDDAGNNFRPDAVVVFPNDERAVIDSKVSLTAYQQAIKTENEDDRERLMKDHVASVRRHVDELSAKNYERLVPGCIGYVLMFIPYESGYSAALKTDASILQYAYRKHIVILSPSNLLMALQLTHTMWQNYRINKNVEEILRQSNDLYDQFVTFSESFVKMQTHIDRLQSEYDLARKRLSEGRGNVVRRLDKLCTLGISPKKEIPKEIKGED